MSSTSKRLLAAMLCVVMALGMFIPAGAAPAMLGEDYAVAEVPVFDHDHDHDRAAEVTAVDQPVSVGGRLSFADDEAVLMANNGCCSQAKPHAAGGTIHVGPDNNEHWIAHENNKSFLLHSDSATTKAAKWSLTASTTVLKIGGNLTANDFEKCFKMYGDTGDATVSVYDENTSATPYTVTLHIVDANACAHANITWGKEVPATCIAGGYKSGTCDDCGKEFQQSTSGPTGSHVWSATDFETTKAATCTEDGSKVAKCTTSGCAATNTAEPVKIEKTGHKFPGGATSGICTVCNYDSTTGQTHTHVWKTGEGRDENGWKVDTAASCAQTGTKSRECSTCDTVESATIPQTAHDWQGGTTCVVCGATKTEGFIKAAGDLESAYIEWGIDTQYAGYHVYVSTDKANSWKQLDDPLVRQYPGYMRADALGLKAGAYQMQVRPYKLSGTTEQEEASSTFLTTGTLTVQAHDRSGYAFVDNNGRAPGAYNMDGTLPANAIVIYVTEETKSTVEAEIVVNAGKAPVKVTGVPGILLALKKGKETKPVVFRIVGTVMNDSRGDIYPYDKSAMTGTDHEGNSATLNDNTFKGDFMLQDCTNGITIEGVGNDANAFGWGVRVKGCSYVEVRNLGTMNCNSGENDNIGFQPTNDHVWVHNCDFFYGQAGSDGDQAKGDGALDTKGTNYVTYSYNHFWDNGKSNLNGLKDDLDKQTYHHNWYDHSDSRHPRVRYTKHIHIYNNYFDGNAKYGVGATTGSSIFVENNYFRNTKYPMLISKQGNDGGTFSGENGGMIKAYGNVIFGGKGIITQNESPTSFDAYVAETRDEKVPAAFVTLAGGTKYNNFDTDPDFYSYTVQSPDDARESTIQWAGRVEGGDFRWEFDNDTQDENYALIQDLKDALMGYKTTLVSVGGRIGEGAETSHTVHNWGEWEWDIEPDCETNGKMIRRCLVCDAEDEEHFITVPGGHKYNVDTGECERCGEVQNVAGDTALPSNAKKLEHSQFKLITPSGTSSNEEVMDADDVKAVADGYYTLVGTGVKKRTKNAASSGATAEWLQLPTDGKSGFQFTVSDAGAPAAVSISVSSTGEKKTSHLVLTKDGAPVADTKGNTTQNITDGDKAKTELTYSLPAGIYQVLGTKTSSTSDTDNQTVRLYYISVSETEAGGVHRHRWGSWTITKAATCVAPGSRTRTCITCNGDEPGGVEIEEIDATGIHAWKPEVERVEPTCEKDGSITKTCKDCGKTEEEVLPGGHKYNESGTCENCGKNENAGTGHSHNWSWKVEQAATCVADGWERGTCDQCDETAIKTIPATGDHRWDNGVITTEPTCTVDGEKTFTCSVCGAKDTEVVDATGHTFELGICQDCGEKQPGYVAQETYVLTGDDLHTRIGDNKMDKGTNESALGTGNFFTVYAGDPPVDASDATKDNRTVSDKNTQKFSASGDYAAYNGDYRVNFKGSGISYDNGTVYGAVGFTTQGPATVKIWAVSGNNDRYLVVMNDKGEIKATGQSDTDKNKQFRQKFELTEAGTYYVGSKEMANYIYRVEVITVAVEPEAGVDKVEVTPATVSVDAGKTTTLTAKVTMTDASAYTGDVTWKITEGEGNITLSASKTTIVTVTGAKAGTTAKVTATAGGVTSQAVTVTVNAAQPGKVDKTALTKAISDAAAKLDEIKDAKPSTDGTDVPKTDKWVSAAAKTALESAKTEAEKVKANAAATQEQVDAAAKAINDAIAAIEVKDGLKAVGQADLQAALTAAKGVYKTAEDTYVISDGPANTVTKGKKFVSQAAMNDFQAAIAGAQDKLDNAPAGAGEQYFIDAINALKTAQATFTKATGTGTQGSSSGGGSSYRGDNTPVSKAGVEKTTDQNGDVTITVTDEDGEVVAKVEIPATAPALGYTFEDVADDAWYADVVNAMAAMGVVKGVSETAHIFDPNSGITRGAMAQILYNLSNGKSGLSENFTDVTAGQWYADAIAWAATTGVVNGYTDNTFGPENAITREQLVTMLYRYAQLLGVDVRADRSNVLGGFVDADALSSWSVDAMTWAVSKGLIQGKGQDDLDPTTAATRAETAAVMARFLELV